MILQHALDRTLLLMRDEIGPGASDSDLLEALTGTSVALIADEENISSHSSQSAFVTAAILMARSGHQVYLVAPNIPLLGPQPPLPTGHLLDGLSAVGVDMLPGVEFRFECPDKVSLAVALGNSSIELCADRCLWLNADNWSGSIRSAKLEHSWLGAEWPFGAMVAGALAAGEAFKTSMCNLVQHAINPTRLMEIFGETNAIDFSLCDLDVPVARELGEVDFVSAGAISSSTLYALMRVPGLSVWGNVFEDDTAEASNLNRYPLLLRSDLGRPKANIVTDQQNHRSKLEPLQLRYAYPERLAEVSVVGVDHIPSRWEAQRSFPDRLVVGATTHWSVMASLHESGTGCAQCLHPDDDAVNAPIPTMACVSFWAGLLAATYLVRRAAGVDVPEGERQIYFTPFRPENVYLAPIPIRQGCPTCQSGAMSLEPTSRIY